jgi:hypothetical protein
MIFFAAPLSGLKLSKSNQSDHWWKVASLQVMDPLKACINWEGRGEIETDLAGSEEGAPVDHEPGSFDGSASGSVPTRSVRAAQDSVLLDVKDGFEFFGAFYLGVLRRWRLV